MSIYLPICCFIKSMYGTSDSFNSITENNFWSIYELKYLLLHTYIVESNVFFSSVCEYPLCMSWLAQLHLVIIGAGAM